MIVFKKYLKVLWSIKGIFVSFMIFFIISTAFRSSSQSTSNINQMIKLFNFSVIDKDESELSKNLISFLSEKANLKDVENNDEAIRDALFYQEVDTVFVIPEGFEEKGLKAEKYSRPNAYASFYLDRQLNDYLNFRQKYKLSFPNLSENEIHAMLLQDINAETKVESEVSNSELLERESLSVYFRYTSYVLMIQVISGIALSSLAFNKDLVRKRIYCSSYEQKHLNKELLLGHLLLTLFVIALPIITAFMLFPLRLILTASFALMVLRMLVHVLTMIAIAFVLTSLVNKESTVNIALNAFLLPASFIGGIFVPLEVLSPTVLKISRFLPQHWFSKGLSLVYDEVISSANMTAFLKTIGIELIMAAAIALMGYGINRQRRMLKI